MTKHQPPHDDQPAPEDPARGAAEGQPADAQADAAAAEQANLLEQLRTDLEGAKDRVLRSQAELENYRKRAAREIDEQRRYANLPLFAQLVAGVGQHPADGQRGGQDPQRREPLGRGQDGRAAVRQRAAALHCTRIEALYQPFNPHQHEALSQQPEPGMPPNTVVMEVPAGLRNVRPRGAAEPGDCLISSSPPSPPGEG